MKPKPSRPFVVHPMKRVPEGRFLTTPWDPEATRDRSADAYIRAANLSEKLADVGIRAPIGRPVRRGSPRTPHYRGVGLASLLLLVLTSLPAFPDLILIENGKSPYRIVISSAAIPSERYAAEELQRYLERMSEVQLPITTDQEALGSHEILLGDNTHLRELRLEVDPAKLGTDGIVLRTHQTHIVLTGGKPRGTLNAVYTLLEEKLGVRWFTSELEVVPKLGAVKLPELNETYVPLLQYREDFWTEMMRDANFAARHRLNGQHHKLTDKHGGRAAVYFPFVHSFDLLIPRELYQDHPEYFPLINGTRTNGYVQRCLSNSEVLKMAVERVRQWIKDHPDSNIISVSQNDTGKWCQCEPCKTLDDAEGSPSASMIRFVNAIAEAIEKDHPHVRIDTLAYQYTRKPPKNLRPRPNVIVRLCSIECCFAHPLETCPSSQNIRFREDIKAWEPVAPLLYVWDYTPNFSHYQQPFPNFASLQANVQFFSRHGVKGLFEQGNYSAGGGGEMGPLRAYVLAKLLWKPDTDVKRHIDEFLPAYYGQAAPKIQAYLDVTHRPAREKGVHAHIFDPTSAPYLAAEVLEEGERILNEAEALAENEAVRFRVQVARLPVWYVKLAANRITGEARTELLRRFLTVARKAGISNISEGRTLNDWAKRMGE